MSVPVSGGASCAASCVVSPSLLALPGVWRAHQLPAPVGTEATWSTGHPMLDAQLPGRGWPVGGLVEVLQPLAVHHEWGLVSPAVARWQTHTPGPGLLPRPGVVLIGPPHHAFTPALAALGLQTHGLMEVGTDDPAQRLWACEQALQCPEVGAVLAWLPHAPMAALRRLQHAAARQGGLLWVFRPLAVQHQASPAVLRLCVQPGADGAGLQVRVLKRRGPLLASALALAPGNLTLQAALAGARWRHSLRRSGLPLSTTEVPHDNPLAVAGVGPGHAVHA